MAYNIILNNMISYQLSFLSGLLRLINLFQLLYVPVFTLILHKNEPLKIKDIFNTIVLSKIASLRISPALICIWGFLWQKGVSDAWQQYGDNV